MWVWLYECWALGSWAYFGRGCEGRNCAVEDEDMVELAWEHALGMKKGEDVRVMRKRRYHYGIPTWEADWLDAMGCSGEATVCASLRPWPGWMEPSTTAQEVEVGARGISWQRT